MWLVDKLHAWAALIPTMRSPSHPIFIIGVTANEEEYGEGGGDRKMKGRAYS